MRIFCVRDERFARRGCDIALHIRQSPRIQFMFCDKRRRKRRFGTSRKCVFRVFDPHSPFVLISFRSCGRYWAVRATGSKYACNESKSGKWIARAIKTELCAGIWFGNLFGHSQSFKHRRQNEATAAATKYYKLARKMGFFVWDANEDGKKEIYMGHGWGHF